MVRIGIVGTGFARSVQIPGLRHVPGATVTALASATPGKAEKVASDCGIPFATDDWRRLVVRDDVDLVFVETPPDLHAEVAIAALEAGKHVLCEKPMALSAGESARMAHAAQKAGRPAWIHHELRWDPGYRKVKELIGTATLGKVASVEVTMTSAFRLVPDGRWTPLTAWNWWSDRSRGGGMWGAVGSHAVDLLGWWLGPVESLAGKLSTWIPERPDANGDPRHVTADDQAHAVLRFRSGAVATLNLSAVAGGPRVNRVAVAGETGRLVVENDVTTFAPAEGVARVLVRSDPLAGKLAGVPESFWARNFVRFARDLVAAILEGRAPEGAATFEDGWETQKLLDEVYRQNPPPDPPV